jgi:hypothetical protein
MTQDVGRGRVLLKRPDEVAHIAAAMTSSGEEGVTVSAGLTDFYRRAAEKRCAVLFAAENEAGE